MSTQAFVDFYENYLTSAEGASLKAKVDAASDAEEFLSIVSDGGSKAGFDFSADDAREVMRASEAQMAKEIAAAGGELSDDQLSGVAGGVNYSTSLTRVNITTLPTYLDKSQFQVSTVMCPW